MAQTTVKVAMNVVTDMLQQLEANAESLTAAELSRVKAEEAVVKSTKTSQVSKEHAGKRDGVRWRTSYYANRNRVSMHQIAVPIESIESCREHDTAIILQCIELSLPHHCTFSCSLVLTPLPARPCPRIFATTGRGEGWRGPEGQA